MRWANEAGPTDLLSIRPLRSRTGLAGAPISRERGPRRSGAACSSTLPAPATRPTSGQQDNYLPSEARPMKRITLAAAAALFGCAAQAQTYHDAGSTIVPGVVPLVGCSTSRNCTAPVSSTNPLPVSGTFSATFSGFQPSATGSVGTPITATTAGATGSLPSGTVVIATNAGATNTACCQLGLVGVDLRSADRAEWRMVRLHRRLGDATRLRNVDLDDDRKSAGRLRSADWYGRRRGRGRGHGHGLDQ
jgi:hypothetical protein